MTFKGLTEELSRTLISEKMQLQGYLGAQLPFAGSTFKKKKKTAKIAAPESFPKWEEASMQQVSPSAGRAAQRPHQQETSRMPEGRAALRQAVVFSEIIGEPVCRKRKRKAYGNQSNIGRR